MEGGKALYENRVQKKEKIFKISHTWFLCFRYSFLSFHLNLSYLKYLLIFIKKIKIKTKTSSFEKEDIKAIGIRYIFGKEV